MRLVFRDKYIILWLLVASLAAGLLVYEDFGVAWDEPQQRLIGQINYDKLIGANDDLSTFGDRFYGPVLEIGLIGLERLFHLEDTRDIYIMRHLFTHLLFLFSALVLFLLIDLIFDNKWLATIGFLMLVVNPRIYAHSFFNSKDIPFLTMFIICFYLAALAFRRYKYGLFLLLGITTGLLTNLRIMGILFALIILLFLLFDIVVEKSGKAGRNRIFTSLFLFLGAFVLTLIGTWPYLWPDPTGNFVNSFDYMSVFFWDSPVLFQGSTVPAPELPWYYPFVWFGISNPLVYFVMGIVGMIAFSFSFFQNPISFIRNTERRNMLLYMICLLGPLVAVLALNSVLYDGWRQLFFIYPSFILITVFGLTSLKRIRLKYIGVLLMIVGIVSGTYAMIRNHPFQQVYFNCLVNRNEPGYLRTHYEMDYWGVSFRQALRDVLERDSSEIINIHHPAVVKVQSVLILPKEQRERIKFTTFEDADYFITNYRWHPAEYAEPALSKVDSGMVYQSKVYSVFKIDTK